MGVNAGSMDQGEESIAIGRDAGGENQGDVSIAIGKGAGSVNQGDVSIAIGKGAGSVNQADNCITLNACGFAENALSQGTITINANVGFTITPANSGFFVSPVSTAGVPGATPAQNIPTGLRTVYYDPSTNEFLIGDTAGA